MKTAIYCRVSTEGQEREEQACKLNWKPAESIARVGGTKSGIN
jgi:DNA invertase Pin-like site-specific DNA recombinase